MTYLPIVIDKKDEVKKFRKDRKPNPNKIGIVVDSLDMLVSLKVLRKSVVIDNTRLTTASSLCYMQFWALRDMIIKRRIKTYKKAI